VCPDYFNSRIETVRKYIDWLFDVQVCMLRTNDPRYEVLLEQKKSISKWINSALINTPPQNIDQAKALSEQQVNFLISCFEPDNPNAVGRNSAVKFRNYISIMLMLNYGLRPGELLQLRVEDIEFGGFLC
jgi:integrase